MPEWADVYVNDFDERTNLNDKALFFIPSARRVLVDAGITQAALTSHARSAADVRGAGIVLGSQAITKIMNCTPSAYVSANKFVSAANSMLKSVDNPYRFKKEDIVACVFKFKDFKSALKICGITSENIADACRIKRGIVKSLEGLSYRVSLMHALSIRDYLLTHAAANDLTLIDFVTIEDCITAYSRPGDTVALAKIEADRYHYTRDDLTPAPATGHPWSRQEP